MLSDDERSQMGARTKKEATTLGYIDRFDISGRIGYREYKKDNIKYHSGKKVPGSIYDQTMRSNSKTKAVDSERRESNYPPFKTNYRGPATYDFTTGHENVSIKNIEMVKEL